MPESHTSNHLVDLGQVGDFAFDPESRKLRGLLLPFGETSRPSETGHVATFAAEDIDLPRDVSVVTLNRAHDRHDPIGRATALEKRSEGVFAEFQLADTDEADTWLTEQRDKLRKLSAEVRFAADRVRARLTGAALVTEGAFASAALFALAPEAEEDERPATPEEAEEVTEEPTPEPTPATETPTNEEKDTVSSIVPDAPGTVSPTLNATASGLFAAIATKDPDALAAFETKDSEGGLFAVSQIQHSGPTTVTIGADVQETGYLGELWKRQAYERKYVPLFNQRALTSYRVQGWRWVTEPVVAAYAGNATEVPSNAVDTEPVTADARRIAGGHRIDRRYLDFNDQSVIESYFRLMAESYARVSDADILAAAVTAAGTAVNVTPKSGVTNGIAAIVQGALKVIDSGNTPTFAVVQPNVYEEVLYTVKNTGLEFLDQSFGLERGSMAGFQIVPGAVGTDNVLVGSKNAIDVFELAGSPIRVEGLAPHHGAIDPALYGYLAHIVNNSAALALIHTTP